MLSEIQKRQGLQEMSALQINGGKRVRPMKAFDNETKIVVKGLKGEIRNEKKNQIFLKL